MSSDCKRCDDDFLRPVEGGKGGGVVKCSFPGCKEPAVTVVNGKPYCALHAAAVVRVF